jgi:hypothetical protein
MVETTKMKMLVVVALSSVSLLTLISGLKHVYAAYGF